MGGDSIKTLLFVIKGFETMEIVKQAMGF